MNVTYHKNKSWAPGMTVAVIQLSGMCLPSSSLMQTLWAHWEFIEKANRGPLLLQLELQQNVLDDKGCEELCEMLRVIREKHGVIVSDLNLKLNFVADVGAKCLRDKLLVPQADFCRMKGPGFPKLPRTFQVGEKITNAALDIFVAFGLRYFDGAQPAPMWIRATGRDVSLHQFYQTWGDQAQRGKGAICVVPNREGRCTIPFCEHRHLSEVLVHVAFFSQRDPQSERPGEVSGTDAALIDKVSQFVSGLPPALQDSVARHG
eukprot:TRINITY_DN5320_c0_g1_i1.p1 TRINITY_DN5320_c0_g1~~TRINITY_DN5320_c0_g1_i1.p1  ORF type:complete len:296 (+),score=22.47 TRINITY_DN5320_c0_g1_i1:105-890(+)